MTPKDLPRFMGFFVSCVGCALDTPRASGARVRDPVRFCEGEAVQSLAGRSIVLITYDIYLAMRAPHRGLAGCQSSFTRPSWCLPPLTVSLQRAVGVVEREHTA